MSICQYFAHLQKGNHNFRLYRKTACYVIILCCNICDNKIVIRDRDLTAYAFPKWDYRVISAPT
jgi:hypothetical protein